MLTICIKFRDFTLSNETVRPVEVMALERISQTISNGNEKRTLKVMILNLSGSKLFQINQKVFLLDVYTDLRIIQVIYQNNGTIFFLKTVQKLLIVKRKQSFGEIGKLPEACRQP